MSYHSFEFRRDAGDTLLPQVEKEYILRRTRTSVYYGNPQFAP